MARWQIYIRSILYIVLSYFKYVGSISDHPVILVISYDGFRYNYLDKNTTPNMNKLRISGSHADYMRNAFITKTFTNHHSIATGVYPEVHGILANNVYDPEYGKILHYGYEFWHFSDAVVPVWVCTVHNYLLAWLVVY
jgi:ectonucleotide pyrophosphatase/phosphodiesterase family protein 5